MRTFFDTEFIENGDRHPLIPVSIGMIRQDGKTYYAEFTDVDWSLANPWVIQNVKPHLGKLTTPKNKVSIASEIVEFVGDSPEFWAYYAAHDWVLLGNLYGPFGSTPPDWPENCYDLKQYMWHLGVSRDEIPVKNSSEHHAGSDARWNMDVFDWLLMRQTGGVA